jgi:hypothetical protein
MPSWLTSEDFFAPKEGRGMRDQGRAMKPKPFPQP